jgi:hypothetical protein
VGVRYSRRTAGAKAKKRNKDAPSPAGQEPLADSRLLSKRSTPDFRVLIGPQDSFEECHSEISEPINSTAFSLLTVPGGCEIECFYVADKNN